METGKKMYVYMKLTLVRAESGCNSCCLSVCCISAGNCVRRNRNTVHLYINPLLPPRRPGFDPGSVHVGFVMDKVALGQVFSRILRFSPVNFIPPVLHY
jgi:hypothetical protein